jgi:hypothetical protein
VGEGYRLLVLLFFFCSCVSFFCDTYFRYLLGGWFLSSDNAILFSLITIRGYENFLGG